MNAETDQFGRPLDTSDNIIVPDSITASATNVAQLSTIAEVRDGGGGVNDDHDTEDVVNGVDYDEEEEEEEVDDDDDDDGDDDDDDEDVDVFLFAEVSTCVVLKHGRKRKTKN